MNKNVLLLQIEKTLDELDNFLLSSYDGWTEKSTRKVLEILKEELLNSSTINERVLRALKDINVISNRNYYDIELGERIKELCLSVTKEIPTFINLSPLGLDFGKQKPV